MADTGTAGAVSARSGPRSEALDPVPDAYARPGDDVTRALGVDRAIGLSAAVATERAAGTGSNELEPAKRTALPELLFEAATEPFVLLLIAAGVLAVLLGELRDGLLILLALIPIVAADVITEYRGERALEALREASAPTARVRRDAVVTEAPAANLVPGDIVLLRGGDIVPADLRLLRTDRIVIDRSVLTGESVPEPATAEPDPADAPLASRRAMAYAGTSVVAGRGEGVVTAVGAGSEVGRIAGGLGSRERRRSPLQTELDRLVRILLVVAIGLIAIVTGLGFARGQPAGANLLAGVSAAIAAIPEEPPVLLAVILGLGAYRLLRRGVLVRRLNAEETLGAIDLIVTDKTGTLTRNRLDVSSVSTLAGPVEESARLAFLMDALRAEDDAWVRGEGSAPGSFTASLERAVEAAGGEATLDRAELIESEPVSDARPISRTVRLTGSGREELAIGAPEAIFRLAAARAGAGVDAAAIDGVSERGLETSYWHDLTEARAAEGERLVAVARRRDGEDVVDPLRRRIQRPAPRRASPTALETARIAGIEVIVVTGDHPLTAAAIAGRAGLDRERIVVGEEIAGWTDERLSAELATAPDRRAVHAGPEGTPRPARARGRTYGRGDGGRRQRRPGPPPRRRGGRDGLRARASPSRPLTSYSATIRSRR